MHQTTIRFAEDTWARIELEANASGVSAAQYVREATVARLASPAPMPERAQGREPGRAQNAREDALDALEGSGAVWAQAQLARRRARELREDARNRQASRGRQRA
jgi:hypothetical protein